MSQVSLSQQLKEGNLFAEQCPSREVLKHVTSRWGVLILVALREGTHRFSDLRRKIGGVSEKMLAQSLQATGCFRSTQVTFNAVSQFYGCAFSVNCSYFTGYDSISPGSFLKLSAHSRKHSGIFLLKIPVISISVTAFTATGF